MLVLSGLTIFGVAVFCALFALAAHGATLTLPPVLPRQIAIERPVRAPEAILAPIQAATGPVWCEASRRWRDPVTRRYMRKPT